MIFTAPGSTSALARPAFSSIAGQPTTQARTARRLSRCDRPWGTPARLQVQPSRRSSCFCTGSLMAFTGAATMERLDVPQADVDTQPPAQETFSWTKQWYAVTLVDCVDKSRPQAIELLGKNLVLWYHDGTWTCFADQCPHRLAPLSEGRIEDGTLECAYHGWRFAPSGKCVDVPQAETPERIARATDSPRSCAVAYPTQVAQGLIYVWPEAGPQADAEAWSKKPHLLPWIDEHDLSKTRDGRPVAPIFKGFQRDLPISYEHQMENLCDPAHFNFVHHGVAADKHSEGAGVARVESVGEEDTVSAMFPGAEGVEARVQMCLGLGRAVETGLHSIVMPQLFSLFTPTPKDFKGADWELLSIYCVPTKPGHVRLIVRNHMGTPRTPLVFRLMGLAPQWFHHLSAFDVTDGDSVLLVRQDQYARRATKATSKSWAQQYYMPTNADSLLVRMRHWVDGRGGGGPFPGADALPDMTEEQIVDRYHQHTKNCPSCSAALKNFRLLRIVFAAASLVLASSALTTAVMTAAQSAAPPLWFAAGAAITGAAAVLCHEFVRKLTFVGFRHSEHK